MNAAEREAMNTERLRKVLDSLESEKLRHQALWGEYVEVCQQKNRYRSALELIGRIMLSGDICGDCGVLMHVSDHLAGCTVRVINEALGTKL